MLISFMLEAGTSIFSSPTETTVSPLPVTLNADKEEIEIRELDEDIYAAESEFKDELVPTATPEALAEEEAAAEDFDFDDLDIDDDLSILDDDF